MLILPVSSVFNINFIVVMTDIILSKQRVLICLDSIEDRVVVKGRVENLTGEIDG